VISDAGLTNQAFLDGRTDNGADFTRALGAATYTLESVSQATGVPMRDIMAAAYLYATGGTDNGPVDLPEPTHPSNLPVTQNGAKDEATSQAMTTAMSAHQVDKPERGFPPSTIVFSAWGPYTLTAGTVAWLTNLALATGNVGREGAGVNPLVSDANCLGANDMGCQPGMFPGYRPVNADNARELEELWSPGPDRATPEVPAEPGLGLAAMLAAAYDSDIKAMWVVGANPVIGLDEANAGQVREALRKLDFLVVQDLFVNETAELADVILPASSYAEKEGTFTNTERRVQRVREALQPVGATKPDSTIIAGIGERLGVPLPATLPKDIFDEIARVVPQYAGMTYARLDMTEFVEDSIPMPAAVSYKQLKIRSLMWPCTGRMDPGSPVLYTDGFATQSGKARMWIPQERTVTEAGTARTTGGDTLMATVGFPLYPFRTGTLSRQSYALSRVEPDPRLHLNTRDAARMGIGNVVPVQVTIEGAPDAEPVYAISLVYDRVPEGTAFLAITMEQAGLNSAVRAARNTIMTDTTGGKKAVPIRVQAAPHLLRDMEELQPAGTGNVLNPGMQPI
jgi:formate dehydrogenase (NADP+) alpha subunit